MALINQLGSPFIPPAPTKKPVAGPMSFNPGPMSFSPGPMSTLPQLAAQNKVGVKAAAPAVKPVTNTLSPAQATKSLPLGAQPGLDAASSRIAAGTGNQTDKDNIAYAQKTYGYSYTAPKPTVTASAISSPPPPPPPPSPNGTTTPYTTTMTTAENGGLYGQLIAALANKSSAPSADYTTALSNANQTIQDLRDKSAAPSADYLAQQARANAYNDALQQSRTNEAHGLANNALNPIPLEFQQGRAQVLQSQYGQEQSALGAAYQGASNLQNAANTQQGLQQTGLANAAGAYGTLQGLATAQQGQQLNGLGSAAGLAQPVQVPYSNQLINPATGQSVTGNSVGQLPPDAQNTVNTLAQQVRSGSMTINDALSRLSGYGQAGVNSLTAALGPGFNTNASNASGATTATGQQLQTAATAANSALDKLESDFGNLSWWQSIGIPITNDIAQSIGNAYGDRNVGTYQSTLHDARAQLQGVLTASGASTPTGAEDMARQYLPDGMTPQQLAAKIAAAKALIQQKVSAFTQSGNQSGSSTGTGSGGLYDF